VFLAIVAVALSRAGRRPGAARAVLLTGVAAAMISLVQCALGCYLTGRVVPAADAGTAATVTEVINRLDGVKMLILAGMAVAGRALARRTGLLPRWLRRTGVVLAVALVASAIDTSSWSAP
jgi:hypothetical protein